MPVGEIQPYNEGYLRADDLKRADGTYGTYQLQVKDVTQDELKDRTTGQSQDKYVLWFENAQKGLVLNAGNLNKMMEFFGRNGNGWVGKQVEVYADDTTNGSGVACKGLRLRSVTPAAAPAVTPTYQQPAQMTMPPAQPQPESQLQQPQPPQPMVTQPPAEEADDIPF